MVHPSWDEDYVPPSNKEQIEENIIKWYPTFSEEIIHSKENRPKSDDPR